MLCVLGCCRGRSGATIRKLFVGVRSSPTMFRGIVSTISRTPRMLGFLVHVGRWPRIIAFSGHPINEGWLRESAWQRSCVLPPRSLLWFPAPAVSRILRMLGFLVQPGLGRWTCSTEVSGHPINEGWLRESAFVILLGPINEGCQVRRGGVSVPMDMRHSVDDGERWS